MTFTQTVTEHERMPSQPNTQTKQAFRKALIAESLASNFFKQVWNGKGELAAIDELMSEDYVLHSADQIIRGRAEFRRWVDGFQTRLLGAHNTVHTLFSDPAGTRVVARWTCEGINKGFTSDVPQGQPIGFHGVSIWEVECGRLTRCWVERGPIQPRARLNRSAE